MKANGKAASAWEPAFLAFLRRELAPSPARWRSAVRLTLISVLGIAVAEYLHLPESEYLVIFLFAVNLPDAWPSLRKAWRRGAGVVFGSVVSLITCLTFADQPWILMLIQAFVVGATLFFSRTTTAPYAVILAGFAFVLLTPNLQIAPDQLLTAALWRSTMATLGAVLGTLAQLSIWPDNPEQLLLGELAGRLRTVTEILERTRDGRPEAIDVVPTTSAQLATQLDLLASVEARSPWLRQHHVEQVRLVTELERILLDALQLAKAVVEIGTPSEGGISPRLQNLAAAFRRRAAALEQQRAPDPEPPPGPGVHHPVAPPWASVETLVTDLEQSLTRLDATFGFLRLGERESSVWREGIEPIRDPLSQRMLLTPDCTLANVDAVRFGLKGALAATVCYLIYNGLNWPGIATCVAICVLVAQSSVGAGYSRALLIFGGAVLGGVAAFVIIVFFVPNLFGLAPFLVLAGTVLFAAAWIGAGTGRTSYMGVQMALAFSLVLFATPGPTLSLAPAGDRIVGVLLGVAVMSLVDLTLWPNFAGTGLRRRLRVTLGSLARMTASLSRSDWDAFHAAVHGVHLDLAAALNLYSEWQLEFGRQTARSRLEQDRLLTLARRIEDLFLDLLAIARLRKVPLAAPVPAAWTEGLSRADAAMTLRLGELAERAASSGENGRTDSLGAVLRLPAPEGKTPVETARGMAEVNRLYLSLPEPFRQLESAVDSALIPARPGAGE